MSRYKFWGNFELSDAGGGGKLIPKHKRGRMIDNTRELFEKIPGDSLSSDAQSQLENFGASLGAAKNLIGAWRDGTFIDHMGNVWLDVERLSTIISHRAFSRLSRCQREFDPDVISLPDRKKTYFRGPLVDSLIGQVIGKAENENTVVTAKASRQLYHFIRDSDQCSQVTKSRPASLFREELTQLRGLVSAEVKARSQTDFGNRTYENGLIGTALVDLGKSLRTHGLTHRRYHILRLVERGGMSMNELLEKFDLTSVGVTNEVDSLRNKGLVERNDLVVTITEAGRAIVDELRQETEQWISQSMQNLDTEKKEELRLTGKLLCD